MFPKISTSALRKGLVSLVLPAVELYVLRLYLHHYLDLRFGFSHMTDYDYVVPAPIAFLLLIQILDSTRPLTFQISRKALLAHLAALLTFIAFNHHYESIALWNPAFAVSSWFALLGGLLVSALLVWFRAKEFLTHSKRAVFLPVILIGTSLYFYSNGFRWIWTLLGRFNARAIHALFSYWPAAQITSQFTAEEAVKIEHPLLSLRIGIGCGGGDGLFYFALALLLMRVLYQKRIPLRYWLGALLTGLTFIYGINIVRIVSLLYAGIALRSYFGIELGTQIFKTYFHFHIGWIFYSVGILAFLRTCFNLFEGYRHRLVRSLLAQLIPANVEAANSSLLSIPRAV